MSDEDKFATLKDPKNKKRIENWEKIGKDAIEADLRNGGTQYIGRSAHHPLAWLWVSYKNEENKKTLGNIFWDASLLRPNFLGFGFDLKILLDSGTKRLFVVSIILTVLGFFIYWIVASSITPLSSTELRTEIPKLTVEVIPSTSEEEILKSTLRIWNRGNEDAESVSGDITNFFYVDSLGGKYISATLPNDRKRILDTIKSEEYRDLFLNDIVSNDNMPSTIFHNGIPTSWEKVSFCLTLNYKFKDTKNDQYNSQNAKFGFFADKKDGIPILIERDRFCNKD